MKKFTLALTALLSLVAITAFAIAEPVAGDFGAGLYTFLVDDLLEGAIGAVIGVIAMVVGGFMVMRQMIVSGIGTLMGGILVLNAQEIRTVLGCTIL